MCHVNLMNLICIAIANVFSIRDHPRGKAAKKAAGMTLVTVIPAAFGFTGMV